MSFPPRPVTPDPRPPPPPTRRMYSMVAMTAPGVYVAEIFTSQDFSRQAAGAFLASTASNVVLHGKWLMDHPVYGILKKIRGYPEFSNYSVFSTREGARQQLRQIVFDRFRWMYTDIPDSIRFYWQVLRSCEISVELLVGQTLHFPSIQHVSRSLLPFIRAVKFHVSELLDRHRQTGQDRPSVFQQMLHLKSDPEDIVVSIDAEQPSVYENTRNIVTRDDNEFFYQIRYGLHLLQTVPDVREIVTVLRAARIARDDGSIEYKELEYQAQVQATAIYPFLKPVEFDLYPDDVMEVREVYVDSFALPLTGNSHYMPQVPLTVRALALRMSNGPKIRTLPYEDEVPPDFRPLARKVADAGVNDFDNLFGNLGQHPPRGEIEDLRGKGYTMWQITHFLENHPFCQFFGAFRLVPVKSSSRFGPSWEYYMVSCASRDDPMWQRVEHYYQELQRANITTQDIASFLEQAKYGSTELRLIHWSQF